MRYLLTELAYELSTEDIEEEEEAEEEENETTHKDSNMDSVSNNGVADKCNGHHSPTFRTLDSRGATEICH